MSSTGWRVYFLRPLRNLPTSSQVRNSSHRGSIFVTGNIDIYLFTHYVPCLGILIRRYYTIPGADLTRSKTVVFRHDESRSIILKKPSQYIITRKVKSEKRCIHILIRTATRKKGPKYTQFKCILIIHVYIYRIQQGKIYGFSPKNDNNQFSWLFLFQGWANVR